MFTCNQLQKIMPDAGVRALQFYPSLLQYMEQYQIMTNLRIAAFLGTVAVESGQLKYVREIWGPTPVQERYEGRSDLGNVQPGDGKRFLGRGLIQITGRSNYQALQTALGIPCVSQPEILEMPQYAVLSACWWWWSHGLNEIADLPDFARVTRVVNGGYNGWEQRSLFYTRSIQVLSVPDFSNVQGGASG